MENTSDLNNNEKKSENNYVYFNFKHGKNKQYKICLSSYYKDSDILELIEEKDFEDTSIEPIIVKVYRFKIIRDLLKKKNENKEFEIDIILEEGNETEYHYTIKFKDINRDFYEYKFKLEKLDIMPLELDEQFWIYLDILRNKYKKRQKTKENEDFIFSSILLLKDKDSKYNLLFYLSVFLQSFIIGFVQNHLLEFDPKKINAENEIPEKRLNQ